MLRHDPGLDPAGLDRLCAAVVRSALDREGWTWVDTPDGRRWCDALGLVPEVVREQAQAHGVPEVGPEKPPAWALPPRPMSFATACRVVARLEQSGVGPATDRKREAVAKVRAWRQRAR